MEIRGIQCAKCRAIYPIAAFKTTLTRAQSLARGYEGRFKVAIESTLCMACRRKPKPISKLTRKELHNRMVAGDLHPLLGEKRREALLVQAQQRRVEGGYLSAKAKRKPMWDTLLKLMQVEITVCQQQEKYALTRQQHGFALFFRAYIQALTETRAYLKLQARLPTTKPPDTHWLDCIPEAHANTLRDMWEALPLAQRMVRRMPALLNRVLPEDTVLPETSK